MAASDPVAMSGHEAAAVRALGQAAEATAGALRHLGAAADVEWSGRDAVRYRAALDDVVAQLRRTDALLDRATTAMAEHAATVARTVLSPSTGEPVGAADLIPGPPRWSGAP